MSDLIGCESCRKVEVRAPTSSANGIEEEAAFRFALHVLVLRHPDRAENAAAASQWIFRRVRYRRLFPLSSVEIRSVDSDQ
jgi:hypothetical protein